MPNYLEAKSLINDNAIFDCSICTICYGIGSCYYHLKQNDKATDMLLEATRHKKDVKNKYMCDIYVTLGKNYIELVCL